MTHPVSPVKPGVPVETVCKTNPTFPQANISWVLSNTTITDGVSAASLLGPDFGVVTISTLKRNYAPEDSGQALVCVASNGEMTVFSQTWQPITAGWWLLFYKYFCIILRLLLLPININNVRICLYRFDLSCFILEIIFLVIEHLYIVLFCLIEERSFLTLFVMIN